MNHAESLRITAPAPDLTTLFCCEPQVDDLAGWIMGLTMANTPETAGQVRQACYELARLRATPRERLALLEQMRPIVHYLCTRMDLSAGTHGDAVARMAQRLQSNLCAGYKAVIRDQLGDMAAGESADETLNLAVHRAISDLSRTLLRTLQFYVAPADHLWLELNQLYLLAERAGFASAVLEDPENHHRPMVSISALFLRAMLMATAKPNQLRPGQLGKLFTSLELWADSARVVPTAAGALFAVDLDADQGPCYTAFLSAAREPRGLDTDQLVDQLERHLRNVPANIAMPEALSQDLIQHLAAAWGGQQPRAQRRTSTAVPMKLCIGLRAIHHCLSGSTGLTDGTTGSAIPLRGEANPFLEAQAKREQRRSAQQPRDVWDDAFDVRTRSAKRPNIADPDLALLQGPTRNRPGTEAESRSDCQIYDATAVDTSPGGYRVRWNDPLPAHLQTGELAALRETAEERWSVGVIRWIQQDGDGTAMGIELLSPRAVPVAVRQLRNRNGSPSYARGLLLPELRPIGQPATLITPLSPFQPGQKVHVQRRGAQSTALLMQSRHKTESFNQFTFQLLAGYLENVQATLKMADQ